MRGKGDAPAPTTPEPNIMKPRMLQLITTEFAENFRSVLHNNFSRQCPISNLRLDFGSLQKVHGRVSSNVPVYVEN